MEVCCARARDPQEAEGVREASEMEAAVTQPRRSTSAQSITRFQQVRTNAASLDDCLRAIHALQQKDAYSPAVIKLARQITAGGDFDTYQGQPVVTFYGRKYHAPVMDVCPTRNDACEIEAIWEFAVLNLRYTLDPHKVDTYTDTRFALESRQEDCDGFTIVIGALLEAVGFQVAARVISTDGQSWAHIFPMVGLPKANPVKWLPLDATEPGHPLGWEYESPAAVKDYLL